MKITVLELILGSNNLVDVFFIGSDETIIGLELYLCSTDAWSGILGVWRLVDFVLPKESSYLRDYSFE